MVVLGTSLWLGLIGCGGSTPVAPVHEGADPNVPQHQGLPTAVPRGSSIALHEGLPFAELSVPPDSRDGATLTDGIVITGLTLESGEPRTGYHYTAPIPIKPRGMFFSRPPTGLSLRNGPTELAYKGGEGRVTHLTWSMDRDTLSVHSPVEGLPDGLSLVFPMAVEREKALHYRMARGLGTVADEADFVRTSVQTGWTTREGLLLPAPATASFDVTVPAAGVLTFTPGLVAPEFADLGPSDGCTIEVDVKAGDTSKTVFTRAFKPGEFTSERLDLSAWADKPVRLSFRTLPGDTPRNDFCFVGAPLLGSYQSKARRVVMVFVDTLRPDHMGLYGYERDTTPRLTAFGKDAAVFEQARSIAPWTLPSARTVITGRQPEFYDLATTLPKALGEQGFATGMVAGNVYLTSGFEMDRDWDHHEVDLFPPATQVTDRALEWLSEHHGQDSLLMVHYMSTHLPYREPAPFKTLWAGDRPKQFTSDSFVLPAVRRALLHGLDDDGKQYLRDRYDQNIRWVDDEVGRLLQGLGEEDVVVLFSDHGEEFWDHGGFEHGHTLHDELLRIPLVIRAKGLPSTRVSTPVSLLDVAPTVLDLLGRPYDGLDGSSLVALAKGEKAVTQAFQTRPQAFGRPLYGHDQWGMLHEGTKWTTLAGAESVFDVVADPGETQDLSATADLPSLRAKLGEALDTKVPIAYRLVPSVGSFQRRPLQIRMEVPGGFSAFWAGGDPQQRAPVAFKAIPDGVDIQWGRGTGTREVYLVPNEPMSVSTHLLKGRVGQSPFTIPSDSPATLEQGRSRIGHFSLPLGALSIGWGMVPLPPADAKPIDATDDETREALEKLGYGEPDVPEEAGGD